MFKIPARNFDPRKELDDQQYETLKLVGDEQLLLAPHGSGQAQWKNAVALLLKMLNGAKTGPLFPNGLSVGVLMDYFNSESVQRKGIKEKVQRYVASLEPHKTTGNDTPPQILILKKLADHYNKRQKDAETNTPAGKKAQKEMRKHAGTAIREGLTNPGKNAVQVLTQLHSLAC